MRIARALGPTDVSADEVTLWSLALGLVAGHLFLYHERWVNAIGVGLFIVSDILDSADGQLARLRGTSTRTGRILDGVSDNLRFVNLYAHLLVRIWLMGYGWPGALLVAFAGLSHSFQSAAADRKSTRLNSSHPSISYAVFCLKKKKKKKITQHTTKSKLTA